MRRVVVLSFFLSIIIVPFRGLASQTPWAVDYAKSELSFTATQNDAPVTSSFKKFTCDIVFDPENLAASKIKVIVDMSSVHSEYEDLITTLKSTDWFGVDQFSTATFQSITIRHKVNNHYSAQGRLTIRDKSKPVTLEFTMEKYTSTQAQAKGHFNIKRIDFGVGQGEWASTDDISNDVMVNFIIQATRP